MATLKPITPDQVGGEQIRNLPDEVIAVFNRLIASNYHDGVATVKQSRAVEAICDAMSITSDEAFERNYLDVEEAYREVGWDVEYEKPAYNESYAPSFTFRRARK